MKRPVEGALFLLDLHYGLKDRPTVKDKTKGLVSHDRFLTGRKIRKLP